MDMPKLSLGSWAFSFGPFSANPWPFSRLLRFAAAAGYDGVEMNGFKPHTHPDDYDTAEKCAALKREIEDLGLGVSGYAADFRGAAPAQVPQAEYLDTVKRNLQFCERLAIPILRVDTITPPIAMPPDEYQRKFHKLAEAWRAAADLCGRSGVKLVWEFEPGFWLNKPSEVKAIVEAVAHPNFKLLFDTSHAYMGAVMGSRHVGKREILPGGVPEYARMVLDHIGHFHIIDNDGTLHGDETSTHSPFGRGHIDFNATLAALRPVIERLEWWCVDYCFCAETEQEAPKAVPFIRELVGAQA